VVSSRRRQPLERGLTETGLRPLFSAVVGLESVRVPKPDPEGLLLALQTIGARAPRAVYIGDQPVDAEAATAAGMPAWTAMWSGRIHPGFDPAIPLHHPAEIIDRLDAADPPPLAAAS
jgi:pyrophosphatase PpaX